jgi:hypothetical protein
MHQSYNVILSQVLPILYISNNLANVVHEINILIRTLVDNGFHK